MNSGSRRSTTAASHTMRMVVNRRLGTDLESEVLAFCLGLSHAALDRFSSLQMLNLLTSMQLILVDFHISRSGFEVFNNYVCSLLSRSSPKCDLHQMVALLTTYLEVLLLNCIQTVGDSHGNRCRLKSGGFHFCTFLFQLFQRR